MLRLVNRPDNRPSQEGAASEADAAIALYRWAGFGTMVLQGDAAFSQSERLDAWDHEGRTFYFGYKALSNLETIADGLPQTAWDKVLRMEFRTFLNAFIRIPCQMDMLDAVAHLHEELGRPADLQHPPLSPGAVARQSIEIRVATVVPSIFPSSSRRIGPLTIEKGAHC